MWSLWLVEMSLQHIQKNSPRLLPKPAKFEKNPPNGYRVIRKTKGGAGGAWRSPIHKQASLAERLNIGCTEWLHDYIWYIYTQHNISRHYSIFILSTISPLLQYIYTQHNISFTAVYLYSAQYLLYCSIFILSTISPLLQYIYTQHNISFYYSIFILSTISPLLKYSLFDQSWLRKYSPGCPGVDSPRTYHFLRVYPP